MDHLVDTCYKGLEKLVFSNFTVVYMQAQQGLQALDACTALLQVFDVSTSDTTLTL